MDIKFGPGDMLTIAREIISAGGRILFNAGEKVTISSLSIRNGFYGKRTDTWYPETLQGIYINEWPGVMLLPSSFVEEF